MYPYLYTKNRILMSGGKKGKLGDHFQIISFDFLLDSKNKLWLLEVNQTPNFFIHPFTILAYCWEQIGFFIKCPICLIKMKSSGFLSTKCFLIVSIEFLLKGMFRVVLPVFFCFTFTSVFTEPLSFITSFTLKDSKSLLLNIKSTEGFKRSS